MIKSMYDDMDPREQIACAAYYQTEDADQWDWDSSPVAAEEWAYRVADAVMQTPTWLERNYVD